jgi:hypothetical protein
MPNQRGRAKARPQRPGGRIQPLPGGLEAADRPYPPLRGLTVCEGDSGCLESGRVQGGTIPLPLTDWGGRDFCQSSTIPEAQRPVPASLSVTGHSPVRVQGGQRLVDRRSGRNSPARGSILPHRPRIKTWRCERHEPPPLVSSYSRSDKPRPERDYPTPSRGERQALAVLSVYPSRQARRAAS